MTFITVVAEDYYPMLDKVAKYEDLLNEFCDRVEKGELRSVKTYAKFCEALDREKKSSPLDWF